MREIKFRVWNKQAKQFLMDAQNLYDGLGEQLDNYGNDVNLYQNGWQNDCFGGFLDDDNFDVQQYTGLKDKNGVEIYEGDAVRAFSEDNSVEWGGRIEFIDGEYDVRYGYLKPKNGQRHDLFLKTKLNGERWEVIGNIYQNKELLGRV